MMMQTRRRFELRQTFLALGIALSLTLPGGAIWAEDLPLPQAPDSSETPSESTSQLSGITVDSELVQSLRSNLLEAQKQAYERELELKKLKTQLETLKQSEAKNPWVNVNVTGNHTEDGVQPAVASDGPNALKTSIQYFKHQYLLKPGDRLTIDFIGEDPTQGTRGERPTPDINSDMLQRMTVLTDGTIVLPPFGVIHVAGKTLKQVNEEINQNISKYYKFALITVSLAEAAPDTILVLGKVSKQGYVKVPVGTTVSQLFKEVGGIDTKADLSHVFIRKKEDNNVYMADMNEFLAKGDINQDLVLQSGDVVVVPEGQDEIAYEQYMNSTFLPAEFEVTVLGAFGKPDAFKVKPGDKVASAIAKAGGPQAHLANGKILLVRQNPETKTFSTLSLRIKDFADPATSDKVNVSLRPNDVLILEDSRWKRAMFSFATGTSLNAIGFLGAQSLLNVLFDD